MEKAKSEALLMGRRASELLLGPVRKSIEKSPSSSLLARRRSSSGSSANSTTFKGVRMRAWGKWVTEIRDPETKARIWLGSFATAEMAARAYDAGMVCLKGESAYASLNFPDSPPRIPSNCSTPMSPKDIQAAAAAAATSSVPAAKPLSIPPPIIKPTLQNEDGTQSDVSSDWGTSQDTDDCTACSASEPVSSADKAGAVEEWLDATFAELEPLQEINFIQEVMRQAEMVETMGAYTFQPQLPISQPSPSSIQGDSMAHQLANLWCLV